MISSHATVELLSPINISFVTMLANCIQSMSGLSMVGFRQRDSVINICSMQSCQ